MYIHMPPERGICMCLQESNFKFIPIVSNNNNDCNNNNCCNYLQSKVD